MVWVGMEKKVLDCVFLFKHILGVPSLSGLYKRMDLSTHGWVGMARGVNVLGAIRI